MINNFARRCAPIARNVRAFSQDLEAERSRWKKVSFGMMGLSGLFFVYTFVIAGHEHHENRDDYPYMKIRTKAFPWKCSDCNLFDGKCFKACREAEEAAAAEEN